MATLEQQTEKVITVVDEAAGEKKAVASPGATKRPSDAVDSALRSPAKKVLRSSATAEKVKEVEGASGDADEAIGAPTLAKERTDETEEGNEKENGDAGGEKDEQEKKTGDEEVKPATPSVENIDLEDDIATPETAEEGAADNLAEMDEGAQLAEEEEEAK